MPLVVSRGPYLLKTPLPPYHTMGSQSNTLHVQQKAGVLLPLAPRCSLHLIPCCEASDALLQIEVVCVFTVEKEQSSNLYQGLLTVDSMELL